MEGVFFDALDEGGFSGRFGQGSSDIFLVHQAQVPCGEKAFLEKRLHFIAEQRGSTGNHDALGVPSRWHGLNGPGDQPVPKDANDVQDDPYQRVRARENDEDIFGVPPDHSHQEA